VKFTVALKRKSSLGEASLCRKGRGPQTEIFQQYVAQLPPNAHA
jgi:hypothetical protein